MVKVKVESIRVSLTNHAAPGRVLREEDSSRYLPIWIGPFEAEADHDGHAGRRDPAPAHSTTCCATLSPGLGATLQHILIAKLEETRPFTPRS